MSAHTQPAIPAAPGVSPVAQFLERGFRAFRPARPQPGASLLDRRGLSRGDSPSEASVDAELTRHRTLLCARIDRQFGRLMLLQWLAAMVIALWISPLTWAGDVSYLHPHLTMAFLYGGVLTLAPFLLTRIAPGERITRLTVAVTQMLMSAFLIHLTGGRIETHFHIFGSLAFLAFYLDWQVLVVASATIAIDHVLRGLFLPYSIFGVYYVEPWRWLEHAGWVVFCDIFFFVGCSDRLRDLRALSARHLEQGELLHHALHDHLTGLPNRSFLSEKMTEAIHLANRSAFTSEDGPYPRPEDGFCCLYVDLDRFKDVNDVSGHTSGDLLLRMVAQRIKGCLPPGSFVARLGGDEFIAMVPQCTSEPDRVETAARAILRSLFHPFDVFGNQLTIGASIGISRFPEDGQTADDLILKSDRAMCQVKSTGRNDYRFYSHAASAKSGEREQDERHLKRAIADQEFSLHYQPIFHVSGPIAGLEALMRWTDPKRGNIPPSHFIPLAEETGMIVQLGSFVLHQACRQATDWHSRGLLSGRIAVNVSSVELAREDYAEVAIRTLRQHYTPPQTIELEVTETALVNDFALAERHLRELHAYGISISIDDFGTGYSSLGRLRQLTLDTLKIDRIFVDGVDTSEADKTVVEHIIAMAHTLGMRVVGEGVESQAQLDVLRSLGCDEIQGFLLSKPLIQQSAETLLVEQSMLAKTALPA